MIMDLKEEVKQLRIDQSLWTSINRIQLGTFIYKDANVTTFNVNSIPNSATQILVNAFTRTGGEGPSRNFDLNIWTQPKNGNQYLMMIRGARYQQNAVSWDTQNLWFPYFPDNPLFYAQCNDVQIENCHNTYFEIIGYR